MATNGKSRKQMSYELTPMASKQLAILVKRHRMNAEQIDALLTEAGEYAIDSHQQGLAAMEQVADKIGTDVMEQMRNATVADVTPGDLRLIYAKQHPKNSTKNRRAY